MQKKKKVVQYLNVNNVKKASNYLVQPFKLTAVYKSATSPLMTMEDIFDLNRSSADLKTLFTGDISLFLHILLQISERKESSVLTVVWILTKWVCAALIFEQDQLHCFSPCLRQTVTVTQALWSALPLYIISIHVYDCTGPNKSDYMLACCWDLSIVLHSRSHSFSLFFEYVLQLLV